MGLGGDLGTRQLGGHFPAHLPTNLSGPVLCLVCVCRGFRWNQAASNALRTLIYDPICEGRLMAATPVALPDMGAGGPSTPHGSSTAGGGASACSGGDGEAGDTAGGRAAAAAGAEHQQLRRPLTERASPPPQASPRPRPSPRRRLLGTAACFAASGALHELIVWFTCRRLTPGLAWLAFFAVQPLLMLGERSALSFLQRRFGAKPPPYVRAAAAQATLALSAHLLFFQPAEAIDIPQRFAAALRETFTTMAQAALAPVGALAAAAAAAQAG